MLTLYRCEYGHCFTLEQATIKPNPVDDSVRVECATCGPVKVYEVPTAVLGAISRKFAGDVVQLAKTLRELRYDALMGCYYFTYAGMYHGVEPDGYIHT